MTKKKIAEVKESTAEGVDDDGIMLEMLASVIETTTGENILEEIMGLSTHEIGKRLRRIAHGDWQGVIPRWQRSK